MRGVVIPCGTVTAVREYMTGQVIQVEGGRWFLAGYFELGERIEPEPQAPPPPNLQDLVERAGRRLAAQLGEPYHPMRHPGWLEITEDELLEHRRALATWKLELPLAYAKDKA